MQVCPVGQQPGVSMVEGQRTGASEGQVVDAEPWSARAHPPW